MKSMNYSPIDLGETKDLSEKEWLAWREHGPHYADPMHPDYIPVAVGGSAASIVMGDNPWTSGLELFDQKSGRRTPKISRQMNQEILDNGHYLEEYVAMHFKPFMKENIGINPENIEIINDTHMYQHPYYKFAIVNCDRILVIKGKNGKQRGILEIKTTGNLNDIAMWKAGIVPKKYEWQCRYYMAVMNLDYCYIACMWNFTRDSMAVILIKRDLEIEKLLMESIKEFVEAAEMGVEPKLNETYKETLSKYYARLYGTVDEKAPAIEFPDTDDTRDMFDEIRALASEKQRLEEAEHALQEKEAAIIAKAYKYMGGKSNYGTLRVDENTVYALRIKVPMHKDKLDVEKFKSEYPALYDEFVEPKLNETALKKKYRTETNLCMIKGTVNTEKAPEIGKFEELCIPIKSVV